MARAVRIRSKYKGPFNFVDGLQINGVPVGTGEGGSGGPTTATQVSIEPIDTLTAENVQEALAALTTRTGTGASVPNATQSAPGIVELASSVEAEAGTDGSRAISPLTLKPLLDAKAPVSHTHNGFAPISHTHSEYITPAASTTVQGKIQIATAIETTTGTDQLKAITPHTLKHVSDTLALANHTHTGFAPSTHTHSIENVTGLANALGNKAESNHTHSEYAASTHTHAEYASATHTHAITDINGLSTVLSNKAESGHTHSEYAATEHTHTGYANIDSPNFTGIPTASTADQTTNNNQLATTAFVKTAVSQVSGSSNTVATQSTVNAGVNNTEMVTPLTLHNKLNQAIYTNRYNANIAVMAANTPVTINHNLNLVNKNGFVINTVHLDKTVNLEINVVDVNSITLTSMVNLTNVYVTIIGAMNPTVVELNTEQITALTGDLLYGKSILNSTQQINTNRYLINDNGVLKCNGIPVREIGVCLFSVLTDFHLTGSEEFLTELPKVSKEGFRFIRVNSSVLFAPEWSVAYVNDKNGFLKRTKQFLDVAYDNNIGVIMSLFWRYATIPDLMGERVNAALGTPGSLTRNFCAQYIQDLVDTFKDHPAIAGWEMGNEYSLFAANGALPHINVPRGTPASYNDPLDVMTLETMRSFYSFVIAEIKKYDTTGRIIMSGNGGPGGVIEKSLSNYLTLLPLDNPMDNWTFHKYSRNFFGNRAYSDLKNTLIEIRNAAYAVGKPLILGEFGQERNETYGGYGGTPILKNGADAVYRSGIQLAFAWNWKREDSLVEPNDFSFHPENTINGTNEVFKILQYYNEKMKSEGYIPPNTLQVTQPAVVLGNGAYGTGTTVTVPNDASLNQDKGFAVSLRVKMTRTDLSNRKIMFKYGSSAGWFIGYGAAHPNNAGNVVYAQVAWSDGSTTSTNNQTMSQKPSDGWVHYLFQVNETSADDTYGMTVFQNGIWINTIKPSAGKTFNASSTDLFIFSEAGAASASHVGIKDIKLYNRALNDVEARNLYMFDIAPAGTVVSHWKMDGDLTDSVGTNHGVLSTGAVTYGS